MSTVEIHSALGTDGSLVSLAVSVNLVLRMPLAVKNPGGGRHGSLLQGLINGDILVE